MNKNFHKKPNKSHSQQTRSNKHSRTSGGVELKNEEFLVKLLAEKENPLILVLDCIQDPHNFGACLRSADGAGVDAVIIPKDKSAPVTQAVISVSCGAAENIPIVQVTNLARSLKILQENHVWLVGTTDHATKSLYETDLTGGIAIVMGAEGKGMRRLTEEACDFLVTLPMKGKVECLNVSVATGICLYEAVRQRN
ncbi:MAG: 23S rRNA (guanosine(2251)-2'-O)-methyltransferase RlmB [Lentisphaeraceae bacterium]|nr:23S rRNA (guanosine(2251)-2'-O)-methyltransferase RlmB [Lentisphaeraceae bacterium]